MTCLLEIMPTINVRTTFTVVSIISHTLFSFIQLCYIGKAAKYNVAKLNVANLRETWWLGMRKHMPLLTLSSLFPPCACAPRCSPTHTHLHVRMPARTPKQHTCTQTPVFFWEGQRSKLSFILLQGSVCEGVYH